jgi:hypothetical protein
VPVLIGHGAILRPLSLHSVAIYTAVLSAAWQVCCMGTSLSGLHTRSCGPFRFQAKSEGVSGREPLDASSAPPAAGIQGAHAIWLAWDRWF